MPTFLEKDLSRQLRENTRRFCPGISAHQIENRVGDGDSDYIIFKGERGRLVELKVNHSKVPDEIRIKLRPGQRVHLCKEEKNGTPAYLLIWDKARVFLLEAHHVSIFNEVGRAPLAQVEDFAAFKMGWNRMNGPGTAIRALYHYLFDGPPPR